MTDSDQPTGQPTPAPPASAPELEERLARLEARNRRVEADKGWETSWLRRGAIMLLTYLTVVFYLRFVVHIDPWINALVPVIGFVCSTLTVSWLKQYWVKRAARQPR